MKKPPLIYVALWAVTVGLYYNTAGAGFVTDQVGWLLKYKELGWQGIFDAFGDKSLHYGYHLFGFALWKLAGLNGTLWMLVFTALHAAVAFLSYRVFNYLFTKNEITYAGNIAFAGSLLFLLSPYNTEPLVWYACIHYLICSALLLSAFWFMLQYLATTHKKYIAAFYACFTVALFTLEISFTFPVILLLFFLFWPAGILNGKSPWSVAELFCGPAFLLLVVYFVLSKLLRGSAVGHYGAAEHLKFSIPLLAGNLARYTAKLFALTQFLQYDTRNALYTFLETPRFAYSLVAVLVAVATAWLVFYKKLSAAVRIPVLLFAFFVAGLLPVLNLYFSYLVNVEGDRLTYFAGIFSAQLAAYVLVALFKRVGHVLVVLYLICNVWFLHYNTTSWAQNRQVQQAMLQSFTWQGAEHIYMLNLPDNFRGAYMYRCFAPDNSFAETMALYGAADVEFKTTAILGYNVNSLADSVTVEKLSDTQYKVTFGQWGNWWWAGGKGATNYTTPTYKVEIDEWAHSYLLTFNQPPVNAALLYQSAGSWHRVAN